jgi:hypothetical protein
VSGQRNKQGEVYLSDGPGSPADYNSDWRPLQIINRNE